MAGVKRAAKPKAEKKTAAAPKKRRPRVTRTGDHSESCPHGAESCPHGDTCPHNAA